MQAKTIRWQHDGRNTDNTVIVPANFRGWTLEVNGAEVASVPAGWETDGEYALSTADVAAFDEPDTYTIRMALVTAGGISAYTAPVTFELLESIPKPPFGLAVA